jgi:hypothetical protein
MGLTLVGAAVLAAIGTQIQTHHTSMALRDLSRAAVLAESAADARQLYNSRRIKTDLFEIQRARIARELREVRAEAGVPRAAYAERLAARVRYYESVLHNYRTEGASLRSRADSLHQRAEARLESGTLLRRRSNRLKDAAAWFQGTVAILAVGVVLRSRALWGVAVLAAAIGITVFVTTMVFVT